MIEVKHLGKSFGNLSVLRGLDAHIKKGSITGLAGPNACGKTTLIKILLGLVVPDHGEILLDGKPIKKGSDYRRFIGYMPQNADFPANLTGRELFKMLQDLRQEKSTNLEDLIQLFELENFVHKPFNTLSGGTKQKIAATTAFMFNAPILILDEPTVGLDPVAALRLKDLVIRSSQQNKTVLLVSHIMSEVEQLVSHVIFLLEGQAVFSGDVENLRVQTGTTSLEKGIVKLLASAESRPSPVRDASL